MRFRSTGSFTNQPKSWTQTWDGKTEGNCNSSFLTNRPYQGGVVDDWTGEVRSMTDTVVPNFRRRMAKGEVIMSPMQSYHGIIYPFSCGPPMKFQETTVNCSGAGPWYKGWTYNGVAPMWTQIVPTTVGQVQVVGIESLFNGTEMSNLVTEASTKSQAKVGRSNTDLWETMAELHKTRHLLQDLFGSALKVIRGNPGLLTRAQAASSAWLAYRYGLSPIMQDIEGVLKGLHKAVGRTRASSRGGSTLSKHVVWTENKPAWGGSTVTKRWTWNSNVSVRATTISEYTATLGRNVGFSTKALVTLPWELLPYSFVVDWFVNVGDFLQAITVVLDEKVLGSCYTVQEDRNLIVELVSTTRATPGSGIQVQPWVASKAAYESYKTRKVGLPSPGLVIKADFRLDDWVRLLDASTLVIQQLRNPKGGKSLHGFR